MESKVNITQRPASILSPGAIHFFEFYFSIFIIVPSVFGGIFNVINIAVFSKIGFKDGVMLTFLLLAVSDACQLALALLGCLFVPAAYILTDLQLPVPVDPSALVYISIWYNHMFCDISVVITTYLAVQRCCCVAMPLHFKSKFTTKRTAFVLSSIFVSVSATYVPIFETQGLQGAPSKPNITASPQLVLRLAPNRAVVQGINDVMNKIFLKTAGQAVVMMCSVVLSVHLISASKFRLDNKTTPLSKTSGAPGKRMKLDLQVIKSVTLVSLIFVFFNVPRLLFTYGRRIEPEFNIYRRYESLYYAMAQVCNVAECLNAAVNIFVYHNCNRKFAAVLRACLLCNSQGQGRRGDDAAAET
ncbi:unnamed protein product [Lymnaea stagnalis]|uniref:G-protein coupled receptors family 1 profile domain-containing protein n=1 Tax=Lymnaea stagnalis TaxID=6523 RepID=A0AAV2HAQ0_LYMST